MQDSKLTVSKAADKFGKSRQTLYAAIKSGKLSATTEEQDGQKTTVVDFTEMLRVYGEPPAPKKREVVQQPIATNDNTALLEERLRHAEENLQREREERERERKQLAEAKTVAEQRAEEEHQNAQHWRKQAEQQTLLLTHEQEQREKLQQATQKKRWWKFGN